MPNKTKIESELLLREKKHNIDRNTMKCLNCVNMDSAKNVTALAIFTIVCLKIKLEISQRHLRWQPAAPIQIKKTYHTVRRSLN